MSRLRIVSLLLILLVVVSACGGPTPPPPPIRSPTPSSLETITIGRTGQEVPQAFIGFNIELSDLCQVLAQDAADPGSYESLYTQLGSGILHIGGHSADLSSWQASGPFQCSANGPVVTPALASALFTFARHIHWQVIWVLPLLTGDPRNAATEAAALAHLGGTTLASVAIGNEPELYAKKFTERSATWDATAYVSEWQAEEQAVSAAAPQVAISGPDTCCRGSFFSTFVQTAQSLPQFIMLTHHYYTRSTVGTPPTIDELLSPETWNGFVIELEGWIRTARVIHRPFAVTEMNSISDGGEPGVSDTAGATLWLASDLLEAAAQGAAFVAMQEAGHASYNVIEDDGHPSVLYPALELAHELLGSSRLVAVSGAIPQELQVMAVQHPDGTLQVVLMNHQADQAMNISLNLPKGEKASSITTLAAPDLTATSHARFVSKTWTGTMPVEVQPESLLVLTFAPTGA